MALMAKKVLQDRKVQQVIEVQQVEMDQEGTLVGLANEAQRGQMDFLDLPENPAYLDMMVLLVFLVLQENVELLV